MTTSIKTCFKCNQEKPVSEFYKHAAMADGYLGKCKQCTKQDAFLHRLKNIDKVREYDRNRGNRQDYSYVKNYRLANPEKAKAHSAIANALRMKKIVRIPCFVCGEEKTQAHHVHYDLPLDVVWLCSACHKQTHADHQRNILTRTGAA